MRVTTNSPFSVDAAFACAMCQTRNTNAVRPISQEASICHARNMVK